MPSGPPPGFPEALYRRAAEAGEPVFRIDSEHSQAVIYVYRGGTLARFGHDHAIASRAIHGYARRPDDVGLAEADLYAPLASLTVDEPALRAQAGFDTQPSPRDIEGTRRHMLDSVLEVATYPFVALHLTRVQDEPAGTMLNAQVTLHGVTRKMRVPVKWNAGAAGTLTVTGSFSMNQTDFGITPYSVLGGALEVQNRVDVHFQIQARRMSTPTE